MKRIKPPESDYGFIKPDGKIVYGREYGGHEQLARIHGFAVPGARERAIKGGWVRFRHFGGVNEPTGLSSSYDPLNVNAAALAEKFVQDHPGRKTYFVNDTEFNNQGDALNYFRMAGVRVP